MERLIKLNLSAEEKKSELLQACLQCIFYLKRVNSAVVASFGSAFVQNIVTLDYAALFDLLEDLIRGCDHEQLRVLYETVLQHLTTAVVCVGPVVCARIDASPGSILLHRIKDHYMEICCKLNLLFCYHSRTQSIIFILTG